MYVVIFKATAKSLDEKYFETAELLRKTALEQFNCVAFEAISEGVREIALSYWHNEGDILRWKQHADHVAAQNAALKRWYESYSVEIAKIERSYQTPD
jgi:heme-degrading monooxygenase HmoA